MGKFENTLQSEAESLSSVAEQRARRRPIKAQSTAIAPAMASICNAERASSGVMSGHDRKILSLSVLRGSSDQNIDFGDLRHVLSTLGFQERIKGGHFIFSREGIAEIVNLQPTGSKAKAYQVKQVRNLIVKYQLAGEAS